MTEFKKPTVYNPHTAEKRIADLEAKVRHQADRVIQLLRDNTDMRIKLNEYEQLVQIIDTQQETIRTYQKIFTLLNAEIKNLREGKHNEVN